ncbi:hypothetical protein DL96DRAFT_1635772, partial [Flagelloscypha sp. PMI_526]
MPQTFPPEIWVQILIFLPPKSLHVAKYVNRVFYHICRGQIFRELDLVTVFDEQNLEQQLQVLRTRLNLAKYTDRRLLNSSSSKEILSRSNPTLIKCLRFMPSVVMPIYLSWTPAQKKPFRSLRRLFRKPEEEPIRWPEVHPAFNNALDVYDRLAPLIPSLISLEELYIHENSKWYGGWSSMADLVFNATASRLTVLSLQFGYNPGPPSAFPSTDDSGKIALPLLRTFRLCLNYSCNDDVESHVQKFTSASPLLREVQYLIIGNSVQGSGHAHAINIPTHPHLRVFKWASITMWGPSNPLPLSFAAHASQLDVVHLDPLPSLDVLSSLNIPQLVELRVDIHGLTEVTDFFLTIVGAENLVVLEVVGFPSYDETGDPAKLFPRTGMRELRELYLGIMLPLFSVRSLRSLASKIPHLRKLALIVEPPPTRRWTNIELRDICETLLYQFHLSTVNKSFSEWKLWDFGLLFRDLTDPSILRVSECEGVLAAIARKVPSITSFYGTGSLHIWEGMEEDIDKKWGGELWNGWQKKW